MVLGLLAVVLRCTSKLSSKPYFSTRQHLNVLNRSIEGSGNDISSKHMSKNIVQCFKQEEEEEEEEEKKKEEELDGLSFELPFHLLSLNEEELDGSCSEVSLDVFREKEKEEVLDTPWSELPFHLLCLFSAPLILRDLDTFRAICKSWQLSSPMSPLRPLLDPPYSRSPCLTSLVEKKCIFFHPMLDNVISQMDTLQNCGVQRSAIQSMVGFSCLEKMTVSFSFIFSIGLK